MYNLAGGMKAWGKEVAVGPVETGLHLFGDLASPGEAVMVGFGLEMGLRDFYLSMQAKVSRQKTKALFAQLAEIELRHQEYLVGLYVEITGEPITLAEFAANIVEPAMEGGLTTEEYLGLYEIDLESEIEVLSLAMAIEVQALDLYLRAARQSRGETTEAMLLKISEEERSHIRRLSAYIDRQELV